MLKMILLLKTSLYSLFLDLLLRLNITLLDLYTSLPTPINSSHLCLLGYVLVKSINKNDSIELKYCGIHPITSNFPESNLVKIAIKTKPFVIVLANITFSVIDFGIKSQTLAHNSDSCYPDWLFFWKSNK